MDADKLAHEYVAAIGALNADRVLALFAPSAVVHSPLYGDLPATDFFPQMLSDTARADLTLLGSASGWTTDGRDLAMWFFRFDWTLSGGADVIGADMVDIAELDTHGRIAALTIVYDTAAGRPTFEAATGRS